MKLNPIEQDLIEVVRMLTFLDRDLGYGVITINDARVIIKRAKRLISKYF